MLARCVSFLTDYGLADGFVAACRGVLLRRAPQVPVLDVTHLIPAGDVRRGAAVLAQTVPYLPEGVHLAVVDPGVGTARRPLVLVADGGLLVGPDNGLLVWAAQALGGLRRAYEIDPAAVRAGPVSATFHGRDLFAPAAADLAVGRAAAELGPAVDADTVRTLPAPHCQAADGMLAVEVLTVDAFGNVQLAGGPGALPGLGVAGGAAVHLECGDLTATVPYVVTFGAVGPQEPLLFVDSAGLLALAVRAGRAADRFDLRPGAVVRLSVGKG